MIVPRGRRAVSARLLARQGVLRSGTCGRKMIVGSRNKPIKTRGERPSFYDIDAALKAEPAGKAL
jgi:hypothetical protein